MCALLPLAIDLRPVFAGVLIGGVTLTVAFELLRPRRTIRGA